MRLNHLNLSVTDVQATKAFMEKYFGLTTYAGERKNFAILRDENGIVLTLMQSGDKDLKYPGYFHIGFIQESEQRVDEINAQLRADGYDVNPPEHSHGYTFYVHAPGGFMVEVLC